MWDLPRMLELRGVGARTGSPGGQPRACPLVRNQGAVGVLRSINAYSVLVTHLRLFGFACILSSLLKDTFSSHKAAELYLRPPTLILTQPSWETVSSVSEHTVGGGVSTLRYIPLLTHGHSVLLNTSHSLPPGPQLFLTSVIQSLSVHLTTYKASLPQEKQMKTKLCQDSLWGLHSEPNSQEWPHPLSPLTPVTPCSTAAGDVTFSTCHLFAYLLLVFLLVEYELLR